MRNWLGSLHAIITISAITLLSFIGYTLMEMRYFLGKWIPGNGAAAVELILILLITGGWLWSLDTASKGRRGGLVALLVFSIFTIMIGLYDMQYALNSRMPWPEELMVIAVLIMGVVATVVAGVYFRKSKIRE